MEADLVRKVQNEVRNATRDIEASIEQKLRVVGAIGGSGVDMGDRELKQMKDKTQTEYIDTLFNTLRIELMKEVKTSSFGNDEFDMKEEINSHDLSIKQVNQRIDGILVELKKLDRVSRQSQSHIQLEITEQADKILRMEK
jgi:hypothetical protein